MADLNKLAVTPLMRQYISFKKKYPDAILLFRVGDFYETFDEDARKTSKILGITLTKRANGAASYVDLAGFPYHALDTYLPKLLKAGQRVAICEQIEDPKKAKKIVKRAITEVVTPGVTLNDNVLDNKENNFLAAIVLGKYKAGVAFLDISTGEFLATEGNKDFIKRLIINYKPKEIIYDRNKKQEVLDFLGKTFYLYPVDDWMVNYESAYERLTHQFGTTTLKGFGLEDLELATSAAGALLNYLDYTQHSELKHITKISRIPNHEYVLLDNFTLRNLEIFEPINPKGKALIDVLDFTITAMGGRLLRKFLAFPLTDVRKIKERQQAVEFFYKNQHIRLKVRQQLHLIADLERLASKIATGRINPKEIIKIKESLQALEEIQKTIREAENNTAINEIFRNILPLKDLIFKIEQTILPDPSTQVGKGNVIAEGVSEELDELRNIATSTQKFLDDLRNRLSKIYKIPSLKIGFNKVFGYYIEVTNTHKNRVPQDWIRKQTLTNAERYITEELKDFEVKILSAEEKINELETKIYSEFLAFLQSYIDQLQNNAKIIGLTDVFSAFAELAAEYDYTMPEVNDTMTIKVKAGRHPVIERLLPPGEEFVPNDVFLDDKSHQILIITGPNMAGKSAYLRQTALITLLAQTGSFVPAREAKIGFVDKIFTRVGASDNISLGESTFMVEMNEAAYILNNLSNRSLIVFDELGRGTSTYDGISLAWSIVEYLHNLPKDRPKVLFATHYHELNEMEKHFKRIKNYNITVREAENTIIFLRKLVRGGSEHSFGIHVAQMAGLPKSIINRAKQILADLENSHSSKPVVKPGDKTARGEGYQLTLFQLDDPVLRQIRDKIYNLDIDNLTPIQALNLLHEIQQILKGK